MAELNMQNNPLTLSMINALRNNIGMFHEGLLEEIGKEADIEPLDIYTITRNAEFINNLRECLRLLTLGDIATVFAQKHLSAALQECLQVAFDMEH